MPVLNYRELKPTPEAEAVYRRWISNLNEEFSRHQNFDRRAGSSATNSIRCIWAAPWSPQTSHSCQRTRQQRAGRVLDAHNITLEAEYYGDVDVEKYNVRKPLIWFWLMSDRSPLGMNHWLGFRFRCMLGRHIFRHVGKGVKIFHNVEFTYGYNLTIGDNCTIHKNVLLNDRGEIILHDGTSISDYANIYSHTHDINHRPTSWVWL